MAKRRTKKQRMEQLRLQLFIRQGGFCFWCGCPMSLMAKHRHGRAAVYATLDHLIKKEHGGTLFHTNIVAAHGGCNSSRHSERGFHDQKSRMKKLGAFLYRELEFLSALGE